MNCGRCTAPMNEKDQIYICTMCSVVIDLADNTCHFKVGPYYVTLIDPVFEFDESIPCDRTIITKGLKQIRLQQELSIDVNEDALEVIWKQMRNE
jgi:hypothetical protein